MSDKKTITFTDDVEVLDHNGEVEFSAKAGDVKELSTASADRWLKRNKAETGEVKFDKKKASKPKSFEEMTAQELRELLFKNDVQYKARDGKAELIKLAERHLND